MTETSTPSFAIGFDVWHEPWIRAIRLSDGAPVEVGIGACLAEAHTLYALHDPSPLVVGGIHRLLTAILQAVYAPQSLREVATIVRAGQFDQARLDAFVARYGERFDLFHATAPFLQTGDVSLDELRAKKTRELKSVAYLFPDLPTGTNRIHFHHATDESYRFCPACCARGLITLPSFASSGGSGIRPSINGTPPIYLLPVGDTLFESLALSLMAPDYQPESADEERHEHAAWHGDTTIERSKVVHQVGYVESLTFPARRVRLLPLVDGEVCTVCGSPSAVGVRHMVFEMGHSRSKDAGVWEDPFIARRVSRGKGDKQEEPVAVRPQPGKALWREYSTLLLTTQEHSGLRPKMVQQIGKLHDDYRIGGDADVVRVRCLGIRTDGKAKIFEWIDESLDAPVVLINDPDGAQVIDDALHRADVGEKIVTSVFTNHFQPERALAKPTDKTMRFRTLRERLQALYWDGLAPTFREFVHQVATSSDAESLERGWVERLVRVGLDTFVAVSDEIGDGADALRTRVEAQNTCRRRLYAQRKEWLSL